MIALDANVLLYAYHAGAPEHARAKTWLEQLFNSPEAVRLPWITIHAFLRISTNVRAFHQPLTMQEARDHVDTWLALPNVAVLEPSEHYWPTLRTLLVDAQVVGPLVTDAALAALAIEHGAILATTDRDFARFPGLKVQNPLMSPSG